MTQTNSRRLEMTGRKKLAFTAMALTLSLTIALIGGELVVRMLADTYTLEQMVSQSLTYRPAVFTRHRLVPDRTILPIGGDPARAVRINNRGLRGDEIPADKSADTVRILFLGGSSTYSMTPGRGRDWPHVAVAYLNARGVSAECINAGVPGHDTNDSVGKLRTDLWMTRPDYVVLYQGYNDQKYFVQIDLQRPFRDLMKPYVPEHDIRLHARGIDRLLCASKLYLELRYRYLDHKYQLEGLPATRGEYRDSWNPEALEQYRLNVRTICDLARNISATPVLCKQGRLVAPDNSDEDKVRLRGQPFVRLTHEAWCRAFEACDQVIEQVAREKDAPVIDVSGLVTGNSELFLDHIHLSETGDRVVGEFVGQSLFAFITKRGSAALSARGPARPESIPWAGNHEE